MPVTYWKCHECGRLGDPYYGKEGPRMQESTLYATMATFVVSQALESLWWLLVWPVMFVVATAFVLWLQRSCNVCGKRGLTRIEVDNEVTDEP